MMLAATVLLVQSLAIVAAQPQTLADAIAAERMREARYLNSWALEVRDGSDAGADALAKKHGLINRGQIGNLKNHYLFVDGEEAREISKELRDLMQEKTAALKAEEAVGFIEPQQIRRRKKREYTPPSDPGWSRQWSLENTGQTRGPSGLDLNVEPAWIQGITGQGIVVGFVDDGMYWRHRDLNPNYDASASYDFAHYDSDPTPDYNSDEPNRHGTSCAGEVGMAKNSLCGVGVAHGCKLGGLKVDLGDSTDATEASALGYKDTHIDIYSNSWGPSDFGFIVDGPGTLVKNTFLTGVTEGRGGKGNIYVWAAGNGGTYYDSCAADGYTSSIYTIGVGSADQSGRQADYDEDCSGKMVVTFSYNSDTFPGVDDEWDPYKQIYTTSLYGECTDDFTGTSASTPLVSGVIALVLQANPDLTWRDVQYLIAYTSNPDVLTGDDWVTSGAGLRVSHHFGFGAIDAEAMVTRARHWINVPQQHLKTFYPLSTSGYIYSHSSVTKTFFITQNSFSNATRISFLEHVVVTMSIDIHNYGTQYDYDDFYDELYDDIIDDNFDAIYDWLESPHPRRGDIKIELTSPQGTKSVLLPYRDYDFINEEGYDNWPFMSVHYWGENPVGTWTLKVTYKSSSGYAHMSGLSMTLYGTDTTPIAVSSIPSTCHPYCARNCSGEGPGDCDVCGNFRNASNLECMEECPPGTHLYKRYCLSDSEHPTPSTTGTFSEQHDSGEGNDVFGIALGSAIGGLVSIAILLLLIAAGIVMYLRKRKKNAQGFARLQMGPDDDDVVITYR